MDSKILEGISPPIPSASAGFACCYRLERIVEGNKRWKIAVWLGQERAPQSASRCAARSCCSWPRQQRFSQRTLFCCRKINSLFFSQPVISTSSFPCLGLGPTSHTEVTWTPLLKVNLCHTGSCCRSSSFNLGAGTAVPASRPAGSCWKEKVWFCFRLSKCKSGGAPLLRIQKLRQLVNADINLAWEVNRTLFVKHLLVHTHHPRFWNLKDFA